MALFIVMLIGIVGTIFIERQFNMSSREVIRVPVRIDNHSVNRRDKDYLR